MATQERELQDSQSHDPTTSGNEESTASGGFVSSDDLSSSSGAHPGSATSKRPGTIAQAENRAVFQSRMLVIFILVSMTVSVACLVYFFTRRDEVEAFETTFLEDSEKVFESISSTLDASLGAIDAYAVSLTSYASASNSTWPLVAMPNFAARVFKIRALSKSFLIGQFQVVHEEDRVAWEEFTVRHSGWVDEALEVQKKDPTFEGVIVEDYNLSPTIYNNFGLSPNNTAGLPYYPTWQQYPTVPLNGYPPYNWDGSKSTRLISSVDIMEQDHKAVMGLIPNIAQPDDADPEAVVERSNNWVQNFFAGTAFDHTEPYVDIYYPVFPDDAGLFPLEDNADNNNSKIVSVLTVSFYWRSLLENILPEGSDGTVVVIENACGQSFTYQINGPEAIYLGPKDLHDEKYADFEQESKLVDLKNYHKSGRIDYTGFPLSESSCPYSVRTYPSQVVEDRFLTSKPAIYMVTAISIFLLTSAVFLLYDILVERRQKKVLRTAVRSDAIVSSLFPTNVRNRLYGLEEGGSAVRGPQKTRLKSWLNDGKDVDADVDAALESTKSTPHLTGKPIADLFPEATVLFADISGFTAWASIREPSQVFILLEHLYGAFDVIAVRRGVFKVETIGDSYVAVAGLPEPRSDHAVVIAKFASDCLVRMNEVTRQLGVSLGPDTEDLAMRFGLHSGPVTAGVLRGQKSRFQLFGDTVNTAARMESTGARHMIQISQATADYLINANKDHWIIAREDTIEVKGKGMMQTYWVNPKAGNNQRSSISSDISNLEAFGFERPSNGNADSKLERLIEWNVDVLNRLLIHIIRRRNAVSKESTNMSTRRPSHQMMVGEVPTVLDEVKEIIELPDYDGYRGINEDDADDSTIKLDPVVLSQLQEYVVAIAMSYEQNPFHNFEHASHVCMSVAKLMNRIVAADDVYDSSNLSIMENSATIEFTKHDHTYGITSDPLTQFACVFSALIHDAEHPGVPNTQLVKENTPLSIKYKGRSVAEQNSIDASWSIFMEDRFSKLREALCPTDSETKRFRQLVVNCVVATDIMDKDLKTLRNARWEKAFSSSEDGMLEEPENISRNRKATIVIEHLIQASDVAHTMQHWHIYRKWNERLFEEMHQAYKEGRSDKDPAEFWYKGEIGFFDFYILPLAKKLSECGVFGVSSDEYLNYATKNREEWERRGEEVVATMVKRLNRGAEENA